MYFDAIVDIYMEIFANFVTLVIFTVSNIEMVFLVWDSSNSVFTFVIHQLQELLKTVSSKLLVSLINTLIKLSQYLFKNREVIVSPLLLSVPTILKRVELPITILVVLVDLIVRTVQPLERLVLLHVYIIYSMLTTKYYKLFTLILLIFIIYLEPNLLAKDSSLHKLIVSLKVDEKTST